MAPLMYVVSSTIYVPLTFGCLTRALFALHRPSCGALTANAVCVLVVVVALVHVDFDVVSSYCNCEI